MFRCSKHIATTVLLGCTTKRNTVKLRVNYEMTAVRLRVNYETTGFISWPGHNLGLLELNPYIYMHKLGFLNDIAWQMFRRAYALL